jgi:hypothetical protein
MWDVLVVSRHSHMRSSLVNYEKVSLTFSSFNLSGKQKTVSFVTEYERNVCLEQYKQNSLGTHTNAVFHAHYDTYIGVHSTRLWSMF